MMNSLTRLSLEWAIRSFGREHVFNWQIRALRLAEEAVELAQAAGVPRDKMHLLIDKVYDRPVGDIVQEIGGVAMTLAVLAATFGGDGDEFLERELSRVLAKSPEHFAKRNQEKLTMGLD